MLRVSTMKLPACTHKSHSGLPLALESHQPLPPRSLDPEADIYPPMQLIELAPNDWYLAVEVDLVAQYLPRLGVRSQRVQRAAHHGRRLLLVVEDGKRRAGHDRGEERKGT